MSSSAPCRSLVGEAVSPAQTAKDPAALMGQIFSLLDRGGSLLGSLLGMGFHQEHTGASVKQRNLASSK